MAQGFPRGEDLQRDVAMALRCPQGVRPPLTVGPLASSLSLCASVSSSIKMGIITLTTKSCCREVVSLALVYGQHSPCLDATGIS